MDESGDGRVGRLEFGLAARQLLATWGVVAIATYDDDDPLLWLRAFQYSVNYYR